MPDSKPLDLEALRDEARAKGLSPEASAYVEALLDEVQRLRDMQVHIEERIGKPTTCRVTYKGVPIFVGRNYDDDTEATYGAALVMVDALRDENTALTADRDRLRERVAELEARVADYENGISWDTTCTSCAKTLDSSYAEYVRAEKAEAEIERLKDQKAGLISDSLELTRKIDAARAEVARLTAVVQGVRELADEWAQPGAIYPRSDCARELRALEGRSKVKGVREEVIDGIEETFLGQLSSKALSYVAQEDVNAGLDAMRERFGLEEGR